MRIVVAHPGPHFSVADVHAGWVEALKAAGQHVREFPLDATLTFYNTALLPVDGKEDTFKRAVSTEVALEMATDRLYATIMKVRPHVLVVISAFFLPPEQLHIIRSAGVRVVIVHTESPYEDDRQLAIAQYADLNIVNDPTNIDRFETIGPAEFFPHAYRPSVHHPGDVDPVLASDFAFVGTGFPSRVAFFEAMNLDGLTVVLGGNWRILNEDSPLRQHLVHDADECFDNTDTAAVYQSSKMGLNFYRREAQNDSLVEGWACGPREIEMAACGLPFLREPRPESDELFPMLPLFTDPDDASAVLRWWLGHDSAREAIAVQARDAIADRTFDNHAARLLRLLDR